MATTSHTLTNPNAVLYAAFAARPDASTAAARVVEHLIQHDADQVFPEAQRARRDMEDAPSLIRGFLTIGPDPRALTLLARDAAEFMARLKVQSAARP